MNEYTRTDLAVERSDENTNEKCEVIEKEIGDITLTKTVARNSKGKQVAVYVTFSRKQMWLIEENEFERLTALIAIEIRKMSRSLTGKKINSDFKVMVVGLGNADVTPDCIGPMAIKQLTVTRHLRNEMPELYGKLKICEVSALSPGVLGQTGIETAELIRGAAETSCPDLVVAIDALAARSCDRLASTVQISDSGINPGAGIGNTRKAITLESIGVPVISIGVPTVVDSSTLVYDALKRAEINDICDELKDVLENGRNFFVTLKETDIVSQNISKIIAESVEKAYSCM